MEPPNLYDLKAYLCTVVLQTFAFPELRDQRDISDFHKELNQVPKNKGDLTSKEGNTEILEY